MPSIVWTTMVKCQLFRSAWIKARHVRGTAACEFSDRRKPRNGSDLVEAVRAAKVFVSGSNQKF